MNSTTICFITCFVTVVLRYVTVQMLRLFSLFFNDVTVVTVQSARAYIGIKNYSMGYIKFPKRVGEEITVTYRNIIDL
jgi:hypothetical protein